MMGTPQRAMDIHPDYLSPLTDSITFKLPKSMAIAIRSRSLTTGHGVAFVVRELIRAGAPHLEQPLNIGLSSWPAEQEDPTT
jgi:hypothetical protein